MHGKVVVIEPIVFFFLVADISEFLQFRKEEVKCPYKITNERDAVWNNGERKQYFSLMYMGKSWFNSS